MMGLMRLFSLSAYIKILGLGLGFLNTVLLTQLMTAKEFGSYSFIISMLAILSLPAVMGVPEVLIREVSKYTSLKEYGSLFYLMRWAFFSILFTLFLSCMVLLLCWHFFGERFQGWSVVVVMAIMIFSSINAVRSAILLGLKKVIAGQVSELAVKPLALFIMLLVLLINGVELDEVEALIWTALATMLSMFVGILLLWGNMPKLNFPKKSINADLYLSWSRSALPLALISGLYVLNQQLDIVMLGILSSDADVGIYKVASQMGFFVIFGQQLIRPVVAPRFSEYWSRGELYDLEKIVVFSGRVSFAIAALVTAIIIVGGEFILSSIFGDEYVKGYAALVVVCIGQMINAATGSVGNLLNMCGKELQSLKALVIGLVVNVLVSVVLIPMLGGLGAAIGTSLSLGVWNLMLWFSVKKNIGINPAIVRVK